MCEVNRLQYPDMFSEVRCYVLDFLNLPDSELLMAQLFRKPLYVEKNPRYLLSWSLFIQFHYSKEDVSKES